MSAFYLRGEGRARGTRGNGQPCKAGITYLNLCWERNKQNKDGGYPIHGLHCLTFIYPRPSSGPAISLCLSFKSVSLLGLDIQSVKAHVCSLRLTGIGISPIWTLACHGTQKLDVSACCCRQGWHTPCSGINLRTSEPIPTRHAGTRLGNRLVRATATHKPMRCVWTISASTCRLLPMAQFRLMWKLNPLAFVEDRRQATPHLQPRQRSG